MFQKTIDRLIGVIKCGGVIVKRCSIRYALVTAAHNAFKVPRTSGSVVSETKVKVMLKRAYKKFFMNASGQLSNRVFEYDY